MFDDDGEEHWSPHPEEDSKASHPLQSIKKEVASRIYGWSEELRLAYRLNSEGKRELSMPFRGDDEDPLGPLICHWSDGDMWRCPGMTIAMYLETRHKVAESKFWEGSHDVTNHNLTVEQKCGRTLLILLKEQTRKILQVHAQWWGPLPLPQPATAPNEHPTVKAAADFVIALSKRYKSCEIEDIPPLPSCCRWPRFIKSTLTS